MMRVHFVQHEVFEAPGVILEWAEARGYGISFSKVHEREPLPPVVDDIDLLVVMGGPQNPRTTLAECSYFDAAAEIGLIRKCIRSHKAVVGVCLGAQLIGEALGAKAGHSPEKEIGIFPIQLTEDGLKDKKVAHFGASLNTGHWHSDMPGLTGSARVLAQSKGCPRQIIAYSDLVYGFQCHMEFTPELVNLLIAEEKFPAAKPAFIQSPEEIRRYDFSEMNNRLIGFLDSLMTEYTYSHSF